MKNIDNIFDTKLLHEWMAYGKPTVIYTIGVDASTVNGVKAYCLTKGVVGGSTEILLTKSVNEENVERSMKSEFEIEVENLAKYFNARIIRDWPIK